MKDWKDIESINTVNRLEAHIIELEKYIVRNCDPLDMTEPDEEIFFDLHRKVYPKNYV